MLLRQMKYFVAIADCGSFTEAAERCFISQSAISQQIAALEEELGVRLIEREGRRCRLTPAGEYIARRSRAVLASVEQMREETVRIGSDSELNLTIGYLSGYDGQELPRAITAFSATYPEVVVNVFKGTHEELYRAILSGEANFLLSDQRRAFSDECENYILNQSPAYIDVAASHPLADREIVTNDELEKYPCIVVSDRAEEETEGKYYGEYLGIGKQFLFAASLDEARQGLPRGGERRADRRAAPRPFGSAPRGQRAHRAHLLRLLAEEAFQLLSRRICFHPARTVRRKKLISQ